MIHVWTVVEIQLIDITPASVSYIFTDQDEAVARFFQICAAAARSGIAYHAVALIPDSHFPGQLNIPYWQIFDRREKEGVIPVG